jgi:hypothetical protein
MGDTALLPKVIIPLKSTVSGEFPLSRVAAGAGLSAGNSRLIIHRLSGVEMPQGYNNKYLLINGLQNSYPGWPRSLRLVLFDNFSRNMYDF